MNIVKMSVATVLALVYLIFAIPLAFLILLLFVVFGLPAYYLVNRVNSKSKAYKNVWNYNKSSCRLFCKDYGFYLRLRS